MTSPGSITLDQLKAVTTSTPSIIMLDWLLAPDYSTRLSLLEKAVNHIAQELTRTRHHKQKHTEDALTVEIVAYLAMMGVDASHDTDVGGHADIVVKAKDDFLWVAEAKKHRDYDWLLQGFDQLSTRYSTGLPGQDAGEVIIYCKTSNASLVMDEWVSRLSAERPGVVIEPEPASGLVRRSTHLHENTGAPYRVRHLIIPLHWAPKGKA
jgi:hypothetical protein